MLSMSPPMIRSALSGTLCRIRPSAMRELTSKGRFKGKVNMLLLALIKDRNWIPMEQAQ
jgi:hypothetical protein